VNESSNSKKVVDSPSAGDTPGLSPRRFVGKGRVIRATFVFIVLLGLFYAFFHSPSSETPGWRPYLRVHARIVTEILNFLGSDVHLDDTTVIGPGFAMEIVRGCDAIEPVAIYAAAVIASPVRIMARVLGVLVGSVVLVFINWVRLVMLYFVGVHWRSVFDILHESIWQAIFIGLAIVFWAIWVDWALRPKKAANDGPA